MSDEGFVFEHRSVMEHAVFQDDWLYRLFRWCVMKANYVPGKFRGEDIPVGAFVTGTDRGAESLGVSRSKFHRGLHRLTESPYEVIAINAKRDFTIVTVCNYKTYQKGEIKSEMQMKRKRNASETPAESIEESNKAIKQEGNKGNTLWPGGHDDGVPANGSETALATREANARPTYPEPFEAFWLAYPCRGGRKRGKDVAYGVWCREVKPDERNNVVIAAQAYARSGEARRGFVRDPERFLKKGWWRDFLREPDATPDDPRGNISAAQEFLAEQRGDHG